MFINQKLTQVTQIITLIIQVQGSNIHYPSWLSIRVQTNNHMNSLPTNRPTTTTQESHHKPHSYTLQEENRKPLRINHRLHRIIRQIHMALFSMCIHICIPTQILFNATSSYSMSIRTTYGMLYSNKPSSTPSRVYVNRPTGVMVWCGRNKIDILKQQA